MEAETKRLQQEKDELQQSIQVQLTTSQVALSEQENLQKQLNQQKEMDSQRIATMAAESLAREMVLITETSALKQQIEEKTMALEKLNSMYQEMEAKYVSDMKTKETQINTYKTKLSKEQKDKQKVMNDSLEKLNENKLLYERDTIQRQNDLLLLEQLQKENAALKTKNNQLEKEVRDTKLVLKKEILVQDQQIGR
jgi:hypothetical protein